MNRLSIAGARLMQYTAKKLSRKGIITLLLPSI